MNSKLKIYYQNIRGMRTKNKAFFTELIANSYDVILLSVTSLNEEFYDSQFFDNRCVVFTVDRSREGTALSRGGVKRH